MRSLAGLTLSTSYTKKKRLLFLSFFYQCNCTANIVHYTYMVLPQNVRLQNVRYQNVRFQNVCIEDTYYVRNFWLMAEMIRPITAVLWKSPTSNTTPRVLSRTLTTYSLSPLWNTFTKQCTSRHTRFMTIHCISS